MLTIMRRYALSSAVLLLLLAASPAKAATDISVWTYNQFLGGALAPLLGAPDAAAFNTAVVVALQQIADNDFPRRAERQAHLIAKRRPHLVGLQEVWSFQCFELLPVPVPGFGCTDPSIMDAFNDHLSVTLTALAAQGANYHAVATVENLDLRDVQLPGLPPGVPFFINGVPALLVALDRDVILARSDVVAKGPVTPVLFGCARPSVDGCNFVTVLPVAVPGESGPIPLAVERGYVAVDVTVDDIDYRFVNTHFEIRAPDPTNPLSSIFQAAQANELIQTLAVTTPAGRKLIVVGDINSSPFDPIVPGGSPLPPFIVPPYLQFVASGYIDIWTLGPPADGFTCCQLPDLSNIVSLLDERIDMIFTRDMPIGVGDVEVWGDQVSDKTTPPGSSLWPSDHGGVAAEISF